MYQTAFLKIRWFILLVLLSACAGKQHEKQLPYYNKPDFTPVFLSSQINLPEIGHTISDFSFTDQHGQQITQHDIEGKIHVANFIFTGCGSICPVMTSHMKLVQRAFYNNPAVVILSFSVTPWIDSVSRLNRYANSNRITSSNWHLLTGDKNKIYTLARRSYFAEEDLGFSRDSSDFLHTEHILLVDKSKRIRGIYNGTLQLEIEQLMKDMQRLLKD